MFEPQSADSIEISAHYYRKESEQWAANARLAKLARGNEPGLVARALSSLGSLFTGRRQTAADAASAPQRLERPLAQVTMLEPVGALVEAEDDLIEGRSGAAAA